MKKSKILIPAFAVLALSVGASVTGTVAWFTANRSTTFGSTFATKDLEGSLSVTSTGLIGTTSGDNGSVNVDGGLYHGSYDAQVNSAGNLYLAKFSDDLTGTENIKQNVVTGYSSKGTLEAAKDGAKPNTGVAISSRWYAGTVKDAVTSNVSNVWYAVAWEMEVKLLNPSATSEDHLFVSFKSSTISKTGDTYKGLRIAFMTSTNFVVIAGDDDTTHVNKDGAIDETNTTTAAFLGHYDKATNFGTFTENYAEAIDSQLTELKKNKGYLGEIDHTKGLKVTAVAWYEGEDVNVQSGKALSNAAASIKVYARTAI